MIVNFFVVPDDNNVINKTLINPVSVNINFKRDFDILNPELVMVNNSEFNFDDFNYFQIVDLNRYYFIDRVEKMNNKLNRLISSIDVLETYKSQILNSDCLMNRKIKTGDYFNASVDSIVNPVVTIINSDLGFVGSENIIMTTLGVSNNG